MCKLIGKSNERILCKLRKSEILRYRCIQSLMLPWKLRKRQILPVNQKLSSVYLSLAKFQLVSCNLSLPMVWQMTYTHKLPKLCSVTISGYSTNPKRTTNGFLVSCRLPFKCILILHRHHAKHCYNPRHKKNSVLVKEFKNIAP